MAMVKINPGVPLSTWPRTEKFKVAALAIYQAFRRTEVHNNIGGEKPGNNYRLRDFLTGAHPRSEEYSRAN
tara:strand:+ start:591 stop:803 length:213 start_codon:yes stop_codon:yes gene_type:complete